MSFVTCLPLSLFSPLSSPLSLSPLSPSVQADMMPAAKLKELEALAESIARLADPKNEL